MRVRRPAAEREQRGKASTWPAVMTTIQRRDDVTIENVKKLIMRAIEEYRNDRDPPGARKQRSPEIT
jgi:hypothetical protein